MMTVAIEQAKHGVRANAVAPGAIATAMITPGMSSVVRPETTEATRSSAAMGRQGMPEEIATVVAFLASDEASFVTRAVFVADGGIVPAQGALGSLVPKPLRAAPASRLHLG